MLTRQKHETPRFAGFMGVRFIHRLYGSISLCVLNGTIVTNHTTTRAIDDHYQCTGVTAARYKSSYSPKSTKIPTSHEKRDKKRTTSMKYTELRDNQIMNISYENSRKCARVFCLTFIAHYLSLKRVLANVSRLVDFFRRFLALKYLSPFVCLSKIINFVLLKVCVWICTGLVGWLEFNVPFQQKYGYTRDGNMHGRKRFKV